MYTVSWVPEGGYCSSKMFRWEPEGCNRHRLCTAISPFWFSTDHLGTVITPFWLSTEHLGTLIMPFWLSTDDTSIQLPFNLGMLFALTTHIIKILIKRKLHWYQETNTCFNRKQVVTFFVFSQRHTGIVKEFFLHIIWNWYCKYFTLMQGQSYRGA